MPDPSEDFFAQRGNARSAGMHPEFYARLRSAIEDAEASTGEKVRINSLTRTRDEQQAAYERYRTGRGGLAAPPGSSQHEIGRAADIMPGKALDWLHENVTPESHGLTFLKGKAGRMDPVHIQMAPTAPVDPLTAINAAIGAKPQTSGATAFAGEPGSLFSGAGFTLPQARDPAPAAPAAAPVASAPTAAPAAVAKPGSMFESAGFQLPGTAAPAPQIPTTAPPGSAGYVEFPGGIRHFIDKSGNFIDVPHAAEPSFFQTAAEAIRPHKIIADVAPVVGGKIAEAAQASVDLAKQGIGDVFQGRPASGLGKAALGTGGVLLSPLTGAANALAQGVTNVTGSPETGERVGTMAGLLIPGGKGVETGTALVKSALPTTKAVSALVDAVGPENALAAVERLRANPRLTWADVSDPVRVRAQGLIDPAQPKAMTAITDAVKQRVAEGPSMVNSAYTHAMGPEPDVVKMVEGLKERARAVGREKIQPALANAKPVDTSPVIKAIDDITKPGIQAMLDPGTRLPLSPLQQELMRFKQQLVAPTGETLTDAARLHDVQSRLGDYAFQLQGSPNAKDQLLGSGLRNINEKLIDQIDAAAGPVPLVPGYVRVGVQGGSKFVDVPPGRPGLERLGDSDFIAKNAKPVDVGAYRDARSSFKDAKDIHQAFDEGFDVLKNRAGVKGLDDRPEALREWIKTATPEEVVAKRLGVRSDIDQKIKSVKNEVLAGRSITRIEYNRQKLETLFGKHEADRLVRSMEDAGTIADTNAKLLAGSKTAETLAGQKAMEVREVGKGKPLQYVTPVAAELLGQSAGLPGAGLLGTMALKAAHMGWQKTGQMSDLARNAAFARSALATGPAREDTIRRVLAHPKVLRELQKSGNALAAP